VSTIDGVLIKKLTWHNDQRGSLMELVRADDPDLMGAPIGQVYVSTLYPGVVKGWHEHCDQTDRMTCVRGRLLLGLIDNRSDSPTFRTQMRVILGERADFVVLIPPGVLHGLKNIGETEAMVCNVVSHPYDREQPDELRHPPHGSFSFDWDRVDS